MTPRVENASTAIRMVSVWLAPSISVILVPVTLLKAIGAEIDIVLLSNLICGLVLLVVAILVNAFFASAPVFISALAVAVIFPGLYAFILFEQKKRA